MMRKAIIVGFTFCCFVLIGCAKDYAYKTEGDRLEGMAKEKGYKNYKEYVDHIDDEEDL